MEKTLPSNIQPIINNYANSYLKQNQLNVINGQDIILSNVQQQSRFELPAGCHDFSKLRLGATFLNSNIAVNGANTVFFMNSMAFQMINRIEVYQEKTNTKLFECSFLDYYNKAAVPHCKDYKKRSATNGCCYPSNRNVIANQNSVFSNNIAIDAYPGLARNYMTDNASSLMGNYTLDTQDCPSFIMAPTSGTGIQGGLANCITDGTNVPQGNSFYQLSVKLGDLYPDSIFGMKKLVPSSEKIIVVILWNAINIAFGKMGIGSIVVNGITNYFYTTTNDVANNFNVTLSNLNLQYYTEDNREINNLLMNGEIEFIMPYLSGFTLSYGGYQQNTQWTVTSVGSQAKLLKTYYMISRPDIPGIKQDCNNLNVNGYPNQNPQHITGGSLWETMRMFWNNDYLLQFKSTNCEDYEYMRSVCKEHSFNSRFFYYCLGAFMYLYCSEDECQKWDGYDGSSWIGRNMGSEDKPQPSVNLRHELTMNPSLNPSTFSHYLFAVSLVKVKSVNGKINFT